MSDLGARTRRGAHRARPEPQAVLLPAVVAILAVAVVLVAAGGLRGDGPAGISPVQAVGGTPTAAASSPPSPSDTSSPTDEEAAPRPDVVVLNQTSIEGLAAAVAEDLRTEGWTITTVGNFSGTTDSTTVYYSEGQERAAAALAAQLGAGAQISPRSDDMSADDLTVVLTEDVR